MWKAFLSIRQQSEDIELLLDVMDEITRKASENMMKQLFLILDEENALNEFQHLINFY